MEPISTGILLALAGGAGGEAGRQIFTRLVTLVRRPSGSTGENVHIATGEVELEAFRRHPASPQLAEALIAALVGRAERDVDFRHGLYAWEEQARQAHLAPGNVSSIISGGTQHGPVIQGRDMNGFSFSTSDTPASDREA